MAAKASSKKTRGRPRKPARSLTKRHLKAAAKRLKNWGRWGPEDEIGTLNYTEPEDIAAAAQLVRKGKVISLALNFDQYGPAGTPTPYPTPGRFNPFHFMVATGTDAYSGVQDHRNVRYADDVVIMPLQCGTQWDALTHIFHDEQMWNGYDIRLVSSLGAQKCGIEKTKAKMVGRGVFLDVARVLGEPWLPDGFRITVDILDRVAADQDVEVRRGDYLIIRTGHMEQKIAAGSWDGIQGEAPGLAFETLDWLHEKQVAAVASDTWGVEVRPNEIEGVRQPWHWIALPMMGLTVGELFYLPELSEDCARDKQYEFLFVAPALPITGAVGSPVNPLAIK